MSTATETMYDVFLSHGADDRGIAGLVTNALVASGLEVFLSVSEAKPEKDWTAEMHQTLPECSAAVIVLTRSTLGSANLPFEIGAAMAWNKPVYVLYDGIAENEIPSFLQKSRVHRISELSDVVQKIGETVKPFSDKDRGSLICAYRELGVATDQLLRKPLTLHELSERYNALTDSAVGGERLVQELIRLRKQGKLPKLKKN